LKAGASPSFLLSKYEVFMFTEIIKQFFPNSIVLDAALEYPITPNGWLVYTPGPHFCRFDEPDFWLILNLQDMLTASSEEIPLELARIHKFYESWADLNRIIVVIWPRGIIAKWPIESFHIIEFSTHQYETWLQYKEKEDTIREVFADKHKNFEFNFMCMNRIVKPHRKITYNKLKLYKAGNCSLQSEGKTLAYSNLNFQEYNNQYSNIKNLLSLQKNFNTALLSIITETQYYEQFGIITEKTFNAIVAGHPFLIIGHRGILQQIQQLGFKTYNNMFDEGYDIINNNDRIDNLIESNASYIKHKMRSMDMITCTEYLRDRIEHNRNFFFEEFGPTQLKLFKTQLLNIPH